MADNRIGGLAAAALLLAATAGGCSGDDDQVWLTTVRVDVALDAPPLTHLCIGDDCRTFDADDEVRAASLTTDAGAKTATRSERRSRLASAPAVLPQREAASA